MVLPNEMLAGARRRHTSVDALRARSCRRMQNRCRQQLPNSHGSDLGMAVSSMLELRHDAHVSWIAPPDECWDLIGGPLWETNGKEEQLRRALENVGAKGGGMMSRKESATDCEE